MQYRSGAASHVGLVRQVNEDSHLVDERLGVWLVADGVGGHYGGKLASSTIVETATTTGNPVSAPDLLSRFIDRVRRASRQIADLASSGGHGVIGSTLAALLVFGRRYACVWAGDSRVYLVRGGRIVQLSKDHTEVQELIDSGAITAQEARHWSRRNVITRAVGADEEPQLDVVEGLLEEDDRFVLCSDGLTGHVGEEDILGVVQSLLPQPACDALVQMALEAGGRDNVTVVILQVRDVNVPQHRFPAVATQVIAPDAD